MPYLHVNEKADWFPDHDAALREMNALIGRLKRRGYTEPYQRGHDIVTLIHAREGSVEIYVDDKPPRGLADED